LVDLVARTAKAVHADVTALDSVTGVLVNNSSNLTFVSGAMQVNYQLFSLPATEPINNLTVYEPDNYLRRYDLVPGGQYFLISDISPSGSFTRVFNFATKESKSLIEVGHIALPKSLQ